jgi:hypothetical protein
LTNPWQRPTRQPRVTGDGEEPLATTQSQPVPSRGHRRRKMRRY